MHTSDPRRALGRRGEDLAARHMRKLGFIAVARNVRTRQGEIDLIAFDGRTLVFVEVKARRMRARHRLPRFDERPLDALSARQRALLRRLAVAWLSDERRSCPFAETIRFDAIGVLLNADGRLVKIEHVQDAW